MLSMGSRPRRPAESSFYRLSGPARPEPEGTPSGVFRPDFKSGSASRAFRTERASGRSGRSASPAGPTDGTVTRMPIDLRLLARLGARVRLQQIDQERAAITAAFRDLGRTKSVTAAGPRPRRKMSAAGKAAIRAAVKRRWAEWRKKKR
jgi:hypothetical protein